MRNIVKLLSVTAALQFSTAAMAGEAFSIQAFGRPQLLDFTFDSTAYGIDVKLNTAINCNGTSTNLLRLYLADDANLTSLPQHNAGFIAAAEIINAAKNGFVVETVGTLAYNVSKGGCSVQNYLIYVQ